MDDVVIRLIELKTPNKAEQTALLQRLRRRIDREIPGAGIEHGLSSE